jgi:preprotein translocase subunit SecY
MTAGTAFVMWLGELITQKGVGNGMSILIFVSILSQFPSTFGILYANTAQGGRWLPFIIVILVFLAMVAAIIFIDQGQRRIPISFAKRVRGRRVMGGQSTYIPIKVNTAGVIPVIFASSFLLFPALLVSAIPSDGRWITQARTWVDENLGGGAGQGTISPWYVVFMFLLIIFFTFFYTQIQFDPDRQSEMIQRQGGFIPGVRPGRQTAEHLRHILSRITLPGAVFLGTIAVMPALASLIWNLPLGFSGVSILIIVGVALETMKQIESQLTMRNYEGFLT